MHKDLFKALAMKAGFAFWGTEKWKPSGAIIDWSSIYDKEIQKFADLVVDKCAQIVLDYQQTNVTKSDLSDIAEHIRQEMYSSKPNVEESDCGESDDGFDYSILDAIKTLKSFAQKWMFEPLDQQTANKIENDFINIATSMICYSVKFDKEASRITIKWYCDSNVRLDCVITEHGFSITSSILNEVIGK